MDMVINAVDSYANTAVKLLGDSDSGGERERSRPVRSSVTSTSSRPPLFGSSLKVAYRLNIIHTD
jgi:hypothetical protein